MSCLKYEDIEIDESTGAVQDDVGKPLFIVSGRLRPEDDVARRVAEVLEVELAQGSMPV
jgi:hypothetical protein